MSRNKIILGLGILVAIMPFLGFPSLWRTTFNVLAGLCLIIMAVIAHKQREARESANRHEVVTEVYVETNRKG